MAGNSEITPVLSKDVSFTDKVSQVDDALKSRAAAQKEIKLKWADVIKVLTKYDVKAPSRRADADRAAGMVGDLRVFLPLDKVLEDKELVAAARSGAYPVSNLKREARAMRHLEAKFPGLEKEFNHLLHVADLSQQDREVDIKGTETARAELQAAVDAYLEAIEKYDDTVESVANVKEYVSVVKDIAEISAIAQGAQNKKEEK